jgi:ribosome-binding protein aMBF1 (putative translation factor)
MVVVGYIPWTLSLKEKNHLRRYMQSDHIATAFGRVLREQRETRGISQEDLALNADVDRSFVSQMERGIRQPTLTTLVKLCRALGVAPSTIVGRMERLLD